MAAAPRRMYNAGRYRREQMMAAVEEQKKRVSRILRALARGYPEARCELNHGSALELLIATILSAQCTDARVNLVTRPLFEKYRTPEDYARAPAAELEQDIRSTGFYRAKARSIQAAAKLLAERFQGRVPDSMGELIQLPGVARKTANVVLGVAFGKAEGIVVDTHVFRVAARLDLSHAHTPEKVEEDLMRVIPGKQWIDFSHRMILHGRYVCKARNPLCGRCPLEALCRSADKIPGNL
jgi:endonuclease-3